MCFSLIFWIFYIYNLVNGRSLRFRGYVQNKKIRCNMITLFFPNSRTRRLGELENYRPPNTLHPVLNTLLRCWNEYDFWFILDLATPYTTWNLLFTVFNRYCIILCALSSLIGVENQFVTFVVDSVLYIYSMCHKFNTAILFWYWKSFEDFSLAAQMNALS